MPFALIFYVLVGVWMVSEMVLQRTHRSASSASHQDAGSGIVISLTIWFSVIAAVVISQTHGGWIRRWESDIRIAGLTLIALGMAVRWSAILTLRHFFTVDVAIAADHRIVRSGPYRWIRHPSYSGTLLSCLGVGLAMANWIATLVLVLGPGLALANRIRVEERALRNAFPDEYPEYARSTRRLIPGVF